MAGAAAAGGARLPLPLPLMQHPMAIPLQTQSVFWLFLLSRNHKLYFPIYLVLLSL
jgi:hypothetical protein